MQRVVLVVGSLVVGVWLQACGGAARGSRADSGGTASQAGETWSAVGGADLGGSRCMPPISVPGIPLGGSSAAGGAAAAFAGEAALAGEAGAWAGGGGEGGMLGTAGEGGAANCPVVTCETACPEARWRGLDGCPTCACAPPKPRLSKDAFTCPEAKLTLAASSSAFIGGINRWLLDFTWTCDAGSTGEPGRATLQVAFIQPPRTPIDETNRTFYLQQPQTLEDYEVRGASAFLRGSGVPEIAVQLVPLSNFISIRREGDTLVGGVHYVGEAATHEHTTTLSGPFRVAVPLL